MKPHARHSIKWEAPLVLYVFEVKPELACGSSRQKCFPGSTWTVQKDPVSHQPVASVFFPIQMSLHYLADLFLRIFHAANIGEPFRWYTANDFYRFRCRSLNRAANSDGGSSSPSLRSPQKNPEERNDSAYQGDSQEQNPKWAERLMLFGCLKYRIPHE
jgi:hypothetical protein